MWRTLFEKGIDTDYRRIGYPPHITIAIYPDVTPEDVLRAAADKLSRRWKELPFTLSGFGIFPEPSATIWAAPVVTEALLARHADLHAALPGLMTDPHHQPGAWMPHITLSGPIRDLPAALKALLPLWQPINGVLDRLDLVHFPPVAVLQSYDLSPG
jgi:2'-5' RNA ligase